MLFFLNTIATDYLLLQLLDAPENHASYLRLHKSKFYVRLLQNIVQKLI